MKTIKISIYIFFLSVVCTSLIADDKTFNQGELRDTNRLQFSTSAPYYSLSLRYNVNSKISLGARFFHFQNHKDIFQNDIYFAKNEYLIPSQENVNIRYKKLDKRKEIGQFFLNYFPFERIPLYLALGINYDFRGETFIYEDWGFLIITQNQFNPNLATYTHNLKPGFFGNLGLGFQWIFQKKYFIGFEVQKYYPINRKENEYFHATLRGIPTDNQTIINGVINAALIQSIIKNDKGLLYNSHIKTQIPEILLWIGYAF